MVQQSNQDRDLQPSSREELTRNIIAALAVSFVALALGAAFGVLSGRGAFAGMISAAIIPIITSAFGGTPVQVSGPTAPMSTVTAVVVAFAYDDFTRSFPGYPAEQFISLAILASSAFLFLAAALRLGRWIGFIPNLVVSGFMNGIAVLIWMQVVSRMGGYSDKAYGGGPLANTLVGLGTLALVFSVPKFAKAYLPPQLVTFLSGTLVALAVMSPVAHYLAPQVERVDLPSLDQIGHPLELIYSYLPQIDGLTLEIVGHAAYFGFQLALLAYLDTLLTSIVVDRITGVPTQRNRELVAQGGANGVVALLGGIPGAQATIRCLLQLDEGATRRWSGVLAGVLVLVEMLIFRDSISLIPLAVLGGILVKVGFDVFDWRPVRLYVAGFSAKDSEVGPQRVSHRQMAMILGTTLVTAAWNLNAAVLSFTVLFYVLQKFEFYLPDLSPAKREGLEDEP